MAACPALAWLSSYWFSDCATSTPRHLHRKTLGSADIRRRSSPSQHVYRINVLQSLSQDASIIAGWSTSLLCAREKSLVAERTRFVSPKSSLLPYYALLITDRAESASSPLLFIGILIVAASLHKVKAYPASCYVSSPWISAMRRLIIGGVTPTWTMRAFMSFNIDSVIINTYQSGTLDGTALQ